MSGMQEPWSRCPDQSFFVFFYIYLIWSSGQVWAMLDVTYCHGKVIFSYKWPNSRYLKTRLFICLFFFLFFFSSSQNSRLIPTANAPQHKTTAFPSWSSTGSFLCLLKLFSSFLFFFFFCWGEGVGIRCMLTYGQERVGEGLKHAISVCLLSLFKQALYCVCVNCAIQELTAWTSDFCEQPLPSKQRWCCQSDWGELIFVPSKTSFPQ